MTINNRENLERATGIIEGVAFCVDEKIGDALFSAVETLNEILRTEAVEIIEEK